MEKNALFYSTNNQKEFVNFEEAVLAGQPPDYGLYMVPRKEIPKISTEKIKKMKELSYSRIAFEVLSPYLLAEIPESELCSILNDAYDEKKIPTEIQHVTGKTHIMWLTQGPTYSFKDYAARFFGRALSYFLKKQNLRRVVVVATSGDTGGAVADALFGLGNIDYVVFYPEKDITERQRRQMTTLQKNVHAIAVKGGL